VPELTYTAREALESLLAIVQIRDIELAKELHAAIDVGKDAFELADSNRKKQRSYRKTVAFTYEEALQVAVDALQAYFVEQPLFVNSALENLRKTAMEGADNAEVQWNVESVKREQLSTQPPGEEKDVEFEIQTETQIERGGDESLKVARIPVTEIQEQQENIGTLRILLDFSGK